MTQSRREFLRLSAAAGLAGALPAVFPGSLSAQDAPASKPAPRAGKKVLLLGGTGFLGPHVVEELVRRGHVPTLFNRGKTNPGLFPDLEKLRGDRDTGDLEALKGRTWDTVVDTSGYVAKEVSESATLLKDAVGQYLFVSTLSVYPDDVRMGADESSPVQPAEDPESTDVRKYYGALKAVCERTAEGILPGRTTNVRPGLIVGPGDPTDRYTYWPVRIQRGGEVLAPGTGDDPVQYIDVRDLARWMVQTIEDRIFGTFNTVGPKDRHPMKDALAACQEAAPGKSTLTWVPADFLREQKVAPWQDMPLWIPRGEEGAGLSGVDCSKAIAKGLTFRPAVEIARDTMAWNATRPEERRAKLRAGLSAERETEVLTAWHAAAAARANGEKGGK